MKIWRFYDTMDPIFAQAGWRGAWTENDELCNACGNSPSSRVQPLILEWEPGSDLIGDFTCTGVCDGFVVMEHVAKQLLARFNGFELGPVEMIQDPKLKKPQRTNKRTKPRVWLPYTGPPLYELWVTAHVPLDLSRSTVKLVRQCEACGFERYEATEVESYESRFNLKRQDLDTWHVPRKPGGGFIFCPKDIGKLDIFRAKQFDGWVLCTNRVKEFVEEEGFTNIRFLEVGESAKP